MILLQSVATGENPLMSWGMIIRLIVIFYFFMIRPQQKEQKKKNAKK